MKNSKNKKTYQATIRKIGVAASIMSIAMYVSYIPQIMDNLSGAKANAFQPFVAMLNCIGWSVYSYFKEEKDWPVFAANAPGAIFSAVAFFTAL
jgi:uncharacterized protein with PQ loop repeat